MRSLLRKHFRGERDYFLTYMQDLKNLLELSLIPSLDKTNCVDLDKTNRVEFLEDILAI